MKHLDLLLSIKFKTFNIIVIVIHSLNTINATFSAHIIVSLFASTSSFQKINRKYS